MQELDEAKGQLSAEQSRAFKLEVELAQARKELLRVAELDKEVARYRHASLNPEIYSPLCA